MSVSEMFIEVSADFFAGRDQYYPQPTTALHCPCGRFAKWVGERHYYNGRFDCYSYTVCCSRCGEVTIECV